VDIYLKAIYNSFSPISGQISIEFENRSRFASSLSLQLS
jgi:hypothetical protein